MGSISRSTGDVYVDLVRDFYAQVLTVDANVEELTIQVRGVFFTLSANIIAQFIGLLRPQVPAYPTIGPPFDMTPKEVWKEVTGADMTVPSTLICHRDMTAFFRMLHLIIVWDVAPKHHRPSLVSSVDSFSLWLCIELRLISQLLLFSRYFEMHVYIRARWSPHGLLILRMLVAAVFLFCLMRRYDVQLGQYVVVHSVAVQLILVRLEHMLLGMSVQMRTPWTADRLLVASPHDEVDHSLMRLVRAPQARSSVLHG
ncbi:hypothetical protein CJ030_MR2G013142 [Morella rubra]|uniref:Uncharacterized protein n=1 Tax=Morella rubra TaxID=262757 RepID=A0A6A1WCJ8_9ROSI|nr:hypothetical protein CJ030_MR2G013142 [Morella rubra]